MAAVGLMILAGVLWMRIATLPVAQHDADEFMFALGGRDVLRGALPPTGIFDNKPVGLLYLFALAEDIGGQSMSAVHGLGLVAAACTAWFAWLGARQLGLGIAPATALSALLSVEILCLCSWLTMSELVAAPLLAAGNLVLIRPSPPRPRLLILIGFVYGAACQVTYLAGPVVALTLAGVLADRSLVWPERLKKAVIIGASASSSVALIWLPQAMHGDLIAFLREQAEYQSHYRLAGHSVTMGLVSMAPPVVAFLLPFLVGLLDLKGAARMGDGALPLVLQCAAALLAATASNRYYPHYMVLALPALSLLLADLFSRLSERHLRIGTAVALACCAAFLAPNVEMLATLQGSATLEREAAAFVDAQVGQDQPILAFNASPAIYFFSNSRIAGRFAFPSHYMPSCNPGLMSPPQIVISDAIRREAKMILVGSECQSDLDAGALARAAGYALVGELRLGGRRLDAYAR